MTRATIREICDLFDTNPNLTVSQIARRYGLTVSAVKKILLSN